MKNLPPIFRVGDRVRARRQRWSVVEARSYDGCQVLTLSGMGPLNAGSRFRAIAPFEPLEPLDRPVRLRIVRTGRWRRECRAMLAAVRPPGSLCTAHRARIDLLPHQLEPALAVLRGHGSRVLVADDVGLGKTIQAGLIAAELMAAGAADRILVLTPAALREQWQSELHDRFGLEAAVMDMRDARRRAALIAVGHNPWATVPIAIASIDYVKRLEVLPAIGSCRWDVVIVDEAHAAAAGSDRHRAVSALCSRAPYVVLLTATPHSGDREAFDALCGLGALDGDPADRLLVFRRTRQDVALGGGRRVHSLRIRSSAAEMRMQDRLARFTSAVGASGAARGGSLLALATLHKRAFSCARSLEATVARRLSILAASPLDVERQLALPLDEDQGEFESADCPPSCAFPGLDDPGRERMLLQPVLEAARAAAAGESKLTRLARLLVRLTRLGESAIVFSEYRDTLSHVRGTLEASGRIAGASLGVLHGGLTRDERRRVLDDFRRGRRTVLLATDAGGEGLNLHQSCRIVINLELPWNPMRLEQRIGRVDRIGQRRRVHAFNLIARDTGETWILERLKARLAVARQDIGAPDPLSSAEEAGDERAALELAASYRAGRRARVSGPRPPRAVHRVGGSNAGPTDRLPDHLSPHAAFTMVRLTSDAAAEHARLVWARALATPDPVRSAGRPPRADLAAPARTFDSLVAFARHRQTRRRLSSRVLVLLQSAVEDRAGRIVAAGVTPVMVIPGSRLRRDRAREDAAAILRFLESWLAPGAIPDTTCLKDFWNVRLSRERIMAATPVEEGDRIVQAGLFDRRTDRRAASRSTARLEASQRLEAIAAAAVLDPTRAAAALVLFP